MTVFFGITIFGSRFKRRQADFQNSCLNYGYAIVRGVVARAVVGAGLMPAIGIGHNNNLNAFNLADDLLEPFRPVVDRFVCDLLLNNQHAEELRPEHKRELLALPGQLVQCMGEQVSVLRAAEIVATSLVKVFREKNVGALVLPEL